MRLRKVSNPAAYKSKFPCITGGLLSSFIPNAPPESCEVIIGAAANPPAQGIASNPVDPIHGTVGHAEGVNSGGIHADGAEATAPAP
ncbi:hypothetical protein GN958_ATG13074 [Phytophthora infestans]|uniref:Uncharacterized protein n=1 Tax=Phytophthora infestans TaxID=4787 RepID=A0A8S9UAB6_PHYIN|nr:hypothetical protein GN958_ATG13074 [Phytophthora infestans]